MLGATIEFALGTGTAPACLLLDCLLPAVCTLTLNPASGAKAGVTGGRASKDVREGFLQLLDNLGPMFRLEETALEQLY